MSINIKYYSQHPYIFLKTAFNYCFGQTVGRLFYPSYVFKSVWFNSLGAEGWKWVTRCFVSQKLLGINIHIPWPVSPRITIGPAHNIVFDIDNLDNFMMAGNYFQCLYGKIIIGKGSYIAPNVGIITANHDITNLDKHVEGKDVVLGKNCWIGMNAMILPGVVLGDNTIVGAGAVVTKSFPAGCCVVAGNPAKVIKEFTV